jgi:hypothetical protein
MAVTKIWDIKGFIGKAVIYIENPDKTENPQYIKSKMPGRELQSMTDVMEYAMTDERAKEPRDVLNYAINSEKTEQQHFVSSLNCSIDTAREEMTATKRRWGKTDGNTAYHGYQAFMPGEVTPQIAHEIGVKLAEKLWGDRFEVVIATHLDRGHLHNHFVLNSVSFADGYKFYDSQRFYRRMQRESDKLCREYRLSVIEDPKPGRSKHHAEIAAEREGTPTWRSLLKAEIDEAISQSMTENQFVTNLKKRGYRVKLRGKDISVCPAGKADIPQNYCRLGKNFGEEYYRDGLMKQIRNQGRPKFPEPEPRRTVRTVKVKGNLKAARKVTGFRALYFHYLYLLGKLPKNKPRTPEKVHILYREDLLKIERISKEITLLCRYKIDTEEQLNSFKKGLEEEIRSLADKRQGLRNSIRRPQNEKAVTDIKAQISHISNQIGRIRKEVILMKDIATRSAQIKEKTQKTWQEKEKSIIQKRKEKTRYEPFR